MSAPWPGWDGCCRWQSHLTLPQIIACGFAEIFRGEIIENIIRDLETQAQFFRILTQRLNPRIILVRSGGIRSHARTGHKQRRRLPSDGLHIGPLAQAVEHGGIDYARSVMAGLRDEAVEALSVFPGCKMGFHPQCRIENEHALRRQALARPLEMQRKGIATASVRNAAVPDVRRINRLRKIKTGYYESRCIVRPPVGR